MKHSEYCNDAQASYKKEAEAFKKKHPNYCESCNGWGVSFSTYDPSPSGVSLSQGSMIDCDTCPSCVDENLCPLCMTPTTPLFGHDGNLNVCSTCNWSEEDETHEGLSDEPECHCYLENVVELV
jgi:hypothetical protein